MKIVKWIVQGLLALSFLIGASFRLFTPYEQLLPLEGMEWVSDFTPIQIKIIAALEIFAAIGLIAPMFVRKYGFFVPLAAIGLALTMIGAAITHILRGEPIIVNAVLFAISCLVAYWRREMFRKPAL